MLKNCLCGGRVYGEKKYIEFSPLNRSDTGQVFMFSFAKYFLFHYYAVLSSSNALENYTPQLRDKYVVAWHARRASSFFAYLCY